MMTRKHFVSLAETVAKDLTFLAESDRARVADALADFCNEFNGNFDRKRFLRACGVAS